MATEQAILISGATGLVGGRLARALSHDGVAVRALTRDPAAAARVAAVPPWSDASQLTAVELVFQEDPGILEQEKPSVR